jgi:hypothetical protein
LAPAGARVALASRRRPPPSVERRRSVTVEARRRRGGRNDSRRSERFEASEWYNESQKESASCEVGEKHKKGDERGGEPGSPTPPEKKAADAEAELPAASSPMPPPPPPPVCRVPTVAQAEQRARAAALFTERREGVEHLSHLRELVGELAALLAEQAHPLGGGALTAEVYVRGSRDDDDDDEDDDDEWDYCDDDDDDDDAYLVRAPPSPQPRRRQCSPRFDERRRWRCRWAWVRRRAARAGTAAGWTRRTFRTTRRWRRWS